MRSLARVEAATLNEPFSWKAWNNQLDAMLAELDKVNDAEARLAAAHIQMARDVRAMIEEY